MSDPTRLLVVDDERRFLETLTGRLQLRGFDVVATTCGADALEWARHRRFDVVLVDLKMPGVGGEELLAQLKREDPLLEVVILTGHGSIDSAVSCTRRGAHSYLQKPCEMDQLLAVLGAASARRRERRRVLEEARLQALLDRVARSSRRAILRTMEEQK